MSVLAAFGGPVEFNLPAQPASQTLMAFARQAGVEVLFSSADLKNVQTVAAIGTYEPAEAIALMLAGTGFTANRTAAGKFVVRRERAPPTTTDPENSDPTTPRGKRGSSAGDGPGKDEIIKLAAFIVTPSSFGISDNRIAQNATLTSAELQPLPQLGEDLYRTISRLPGLSGNDFSAKFMVRGAPNNQLLARFDGVDLVEPFHLKDFDGSLSIIDLETVGSIDLTTGGFTAQYGDRLAGVFTIETQADPGAKMRTTLGLSVTDLRATNQGEFAGGDGQWMIAARRGYVDLALKLGGNKVKDSPTYYDVSGKTQYRLSPNQTISLHVLHAGDTFKSLNNTPPDPDLRSSYDSTYLWGRWLGGFGDRVSGEVVLSFSRLDWHRKGDGLYDEVDTSVIHPLTLRDDRSLDTVGMRNDWTINLTEHALVRTGFEFKSTEARYDYSLSRVRYALSDGVLGTETLAIDTHIRPNGDQAGAYITPRFQPWVPLIIEPGIRFDRESWTGDSSWSPRLNASYTRGHTTLRAAWGLYRQAQGLHELSVGDGETTFRSPEHAEQRVIGISHKLDSGIELRLEAYERLSTQLRPYWVNLTEPFNYMPETLYDRVELNPTRSRARGVELFAEHRGSGRFGWSASYAYARNEDLIDGRWFPRYWDQRHTFYMDVTYVPARNWQLSAAWQYHTGWSYTEQNFHLVHLNNGGLAYAWDYGEMGARHAPAYHRLDLRATRTYRFEQGTLRVFVDIWNAYDRKNEVGYDKHFAYISNGQLYVVKTPGKMLSILPSAGLSWEF
jgi:hypothetical protein